MSTFPGLALLVIKSLLGVISQILDQVAALKKQIAALQERVRVTEPDRLPQGPTRPSPPPGPSPSGSLLQRPTPRPSQTARCKPGKGRFSFRDPPDPGRATEPPVEVGLTERVCPWCGQPLEEEGVESASTTEIPPHPQPTVRFYRVHVIAAGRAAGGWRLSSRLGPRSVWGHRPSGGSAVMATAHVLHYGVGIPVRKVPTVLRILTGIELTEPAIVQDAQQRVPTQWGRSIGTCGSRSRPLRWSTPTTPGGGLAAYPPS